MPSAWAPSISTGTSLESEQGHHVVQEIQAHRAGSCSVLQNILELTCPSTGMPLQSCRTGGMQHDLGLYTERAVLCSVTCTTPTRRFVKCIKKAWTEAILLSSAKGTIVSQLHAQAILAAILQPLNGTRGHPASMPSTCPYTAAHTSKAHLSQHSTVDAASKPA
jgi:hypothetical protein